MNAARPRKGESTPLVVVFLSMTGSGLGMLIGMLVWVGQSTVLHFVPVLPLGIAGYGLGKLIYRMRGYRDILE